MLAAFLLYLRQFFEPMQEISQFYNTFQSASAALEKLSGVLEEEPSVPEPVAPVRLSDLAVPIAPGARRLRVRRRAARHTRARWSPAGKTLALVGTTGAGKTTLAKLVSRFYDPAVGRITFDGVDLRDLGEDDLRRAVVMVTQENFCSTGPWPTTSGSVSPTRRWRRSSTAAKAIGAHDFIVRSARGLRHRRGRTVAVGCRPASDSWWRSPGRSWPTRRC